jgi:anti-sigma factor RsiW
VTDTRFSDDLIAQYLLGELSEKQQVELEDRAFQDLVLLSNITAVEHDLIDDYVAGQIRDAKLERFESHFLASAERRKKVAFAKALVSVNICRSHCGQK